METDFRIAESRYLRMLGDPDRYSEEERFEIEREFSRQSTEMILASLILECRL